MFDLGQKVLQKRPNERFSDSLGHNVLDHFKILAKFSFTENKLALVPSIANIVYGLPHELRNDLRLKILGK